MIAKKTDNTDWLQVLEVIPKTKFDTGLVDETVQTCKFVEILSEDDIQGYWVIPINALRRFRRSVWIKKDVLLAQVTDIEFTPVKNYFDKNRKEYDGYVPQFVDISPKNYISGVGKGNKD